MLQGLGATLRKARNRRGLPLADVEAEIKIRVRYLRAIEEEDWEALPGGSYARSFIRTYAGYLGLDGERLAAEFEPVAEPPAARAGERRRRPPRALLTAAVVLVLLAVVVAVGLSTGGGGGPPSAPVGGNAPSRGGASEGGRSHGPVPASGSQPAGVALSLSAKAEVWVCVLDAKGHPLVEGQVLPTGATEGPFHSGSFTVAFGNGEVTMQVDGKETEIPESASPLGYAIDGDGRLSPLAEAERPTCL